MTNRFYYLSAVIYDLIVNMRILHYIHKELRLERYSSKLYVVISESDLCPPVCAT